ncbi:DUF6708 domain-containing protein [Trinickia soli]|uniref:DUF6708 domain-containing protein n=1 Tax=Trinickia soli TaxID=380675 RepID=A0A2N7W4P4_9BURK|nr:DUF6708 domain-containing protein [Trinickia soli]PMS24363.1 hypothetical protein C0Z19_13915 [Trinickia soli]CAB3675432.1 hypothetical protein LMG24076_02143 [Trinickia soli]
MAFDGLAWYRLNRPVTEIEASSRLDVSKPLTEEPKSSGTVFNVTDSFLEVCDGLHREKGWGFLAFVTGGTLALCLLVVFLWLLTDMPAAIREKGQAWVIYWWVTPLAVVTLCLFALTVRLLLVDCFNYVRKPIRFNRLNRTIYAFRHNGPGGVLSVPWDNAFLYVERKQKTGLGGTAPRVVRCLVLNDKGLVIDTFSIGKYIDLAFDESSPAGKKVMGELYQDFEYYRRFMEEGPSSVPPVAEFLTTEVSFRNALKLQFDGASDLMNSGNPVMWLVMVVAVIPTFIQAVAYYLSQLTCREPVWPEEVERACSPTTTPAEGLTL